MRKGSMLAGLRPRDDDSETELEEAPDSEAPDSAPAPKARAAAKPSQKGVPKPSPEETREIDQRIFDAADRLTAKLGRAPTRKELVDAAKVPGATQDGREQRVSVAMRRRALLAKDKPTRAPAKKAAPVAPKTAPAAAPREDTVGVRAVEALRDRLRHRRDAGRVVAELRAWARRDRDGWDVARTRDGRRRSYSPDTTSARYRASALRGSRRSAAVNRGVSK